MLISLFSIFLIIFINQIQHIALVDSTKKIACKDEQNRDVDWFYIYKLPKHYNNNKNDAKIKSKSHMKSKRDVQGYHYMYVTSEDSGGWHFSNQTIDNMNSMTAISLQPLFDDDNILLIAYNDEYPNGTLKTYGGHTKGLVATDGQTGIWLIHSVPRFPNISEQYEYPTSGINFGQSFLCLTVPVSEIDKIAEQMLINQPSVYYHRLTDKWSKQFPNWQLVIQGDWNRTAPYYNVKDLTTLSGVKFKSFAKSNKYQKELYEDLMAPILKSNLLVETWRNGGGNFDSNCTLSRKIYNIQNIRNDNLDISFKTSQDHSKWAVAQPTGFKILHWRIGNSANWICVGDINRQQGQLNRGGGQVCQNNQRISKLYRSIIDTFEKC